MTPQPMLRACHPGKGEWSSSFSLLMSICWRLVSSRTLGKETDRQCSWKPSLAGYELCWRGCEQATPQHLCSWPSSLPVPSLPHVVHSTDPELWPLPLDVSPHSQAALDFPGHPHSPPSRANYQMFSLRALRGHGITVSALL